MWGTDYNILTLLQASKLPLWSNTQTRRSSPPSVTWFLLSGSVGGLPLDPSSSGIQESRKATVSRPSRWRCSLKWEWATFSRPTHVSTLVKSCISSRQSCLKHWTPFWLRFREKDNDYQTCFLLSNTGRRQQWPTVVRGAAAGGQVFPGWAHYWPVRGGHHESQHCGHLWDSGEGLGHAELHTGGYEGTHRPLLVKLVAYFELLILWNGWSFRLSLESTWRLRRWSLLMWLIMTHGGCGRLGIGASRKTSRSVFLSLSSG